MYDYKVERAKIFTEDGQVTFLKVRDQIHRLLKVSGAVTMGRAIANIGGDSWVLLACVDRLAELGEIKEAVYKCNWTTDRIFVEA